MEMVEGLPKRTGPTGKRGSKYDELWAKVADGSTWKLVQNVDFECAVTSIYQSAFKYGKQNGLTLRTRREGDEVLYVHFTPQTPEEAARPKRVRKPKVADTE